MTHDEYGKSILLKAGNSFVKIYGPTLEVDYKHGRTARIDGTYKGIIAIEIESRVPKQIRGALIDLICHDYPKKLLVILPVHQPNPETTANQCKYILEHFLPKDSFLVVVLKGYGNNPQFEHDVRVVKDALHQLEAS